MDIPKDFKSFQDQVQDCLKKTTKTAGYIAAEDLNFHRSSNAAVAKALGSQNDRLLRLTNRLTKYATSGSEVRPPQLRDQEDVEDNWRGVVDVIDDLLERTDACLDEFTGVIKRLSPSRQTPATEASPSRPAKFPSMYGGPSLNMAKPQLLFEKATDNMLETPFKPLLTSKPHAIVPLGESIGDGEKEYLHPYATEIKQSQYPPTAYEQGTPQPPQSLDSPATFVDTPEALHDMLEELKTAGEIAVDLEHHDTRSYIGIVSLMQISTRNKDWIVDTLKPWRHKLQILNEVFADPSILKIFHGSYMDIIWLQRDLGLYVVNLFDTFHASEALGLQKHSLKYLLEKYCNLNVSKIYQMADWRIRPIPQAMLDYARSDTHYLLYVYDCMRNELIAASSPEASLIDYVREESNKFALQTYKRPIYDAENGKGPGGWDNALLKSATYLSKEQLFVFKAVHHWRDKVARLQDDGLHHVMSNALLFQIAQVMPLNQVSLNKECRTLTSTIRSKTTELLGIVKGAKRAAANEPTVVPQAAVREERSVPLLQEKQERAGPAPLTPKSSAKGQSLRATNSQFWGNTFPIRTVQDPEMSGIEGFDLAYPMPALVSTVSEDTFESNESNHVPTTTKVPTDPNPESPTPTDDVFTLKQLGGSRKRKADTLQVPENRNPENDEDDGSVIPLVSFDEYDQAKKITKAERKAQRKARKAQAAEDQQNGSSPAPGAATENSDDVIPFDYENAESVLHAKSDVPERFKGKGKKGKGDKKDKSKEFNPYAKALDAPSGVRRLQTETPGKSFTYKS